MSPGDPNVNMMRVGKTPEELGVINQKGLNRKVCAEFIAQLLDTH